MPLVFAVIYILQFSRAFCRSGDTFKLALR
jgi:hypothetical protein